MIRITQMLIFFGAICLTSTTEVASSTEEHVSQISQCIQPINYNIALEIQTANLIVNSTVVLNMSCEQQYIRLHLGRYCNITKVDVKTAIEYNLFSSYWDPMQSNTTKNRKRVDISLNEKKRGIPVLDTVHSLREERKLTLKSGIYTIHSVYSCTLKEVVTIDSYISQNETKKFQILSRTPNEWIFPYWENPAIKARFTIQIKHNYTYKAFSNMPIKYQTNGTRTIETVFFTTPLISTHLLAFLVIPNEYKTDTTTNSNVTITNSLVMSNDTYYARTLIRNITIRVRNVLDDIIPRSNVFYVLLPITSFYYEGFVTPGSVFVSEVKSIYNSKVNSIIKEREVTCFIARNVLQEIFSDWLPTFEQSDPWFLEGFLTVYGVYIWDESLVKPFVVQTRRNILDYIEAFSENDFPIQKNLSIARNSTRRKLWREKGFITFYMLNKFARDILYDSMFKEAAHSYYITDNTSNNAYNNLTILDNLWYWNFESSFNKSTFPMTNMKRIITSWTTQVGYPVLQVKRHDNKQNLILTVKDCFVVDHKKQCEQKWWIPVNLYQILESKVIASSFTSLDPDDKSIILLLCKENVSAIVDSAGYRVNYDRQSWKDIAFFLKTIDLKTANLSDVTLAQILDDAFYFLVQNRQYTESTGSDSEDIFLKDLDIYLELASSIFHVDNSYIAWYPVFISLEIMSKIFPYSDRVVSIIKEKLLELLNKFSDDISYTHSSKNTVNNQFYHEVLKWTCILNGSKCKDHVEKIFEWHFESSAHNKSLLLPSWQKWIYCRKLKLETYDDSTVMLPLFNLYWKQKKEKEFFELVSCFKQFENGPSFLSFLDQIFSLQTYIVNESFTVRLLFNIVASYSNNKSILPIILSANYLGSKLGITVVSEMTNLALINCIINNIYSRNVLSLIINKEFLKKHLDIKDMVNVFRDSFKIKPFVLDVIKKKAENRRSYLLRRQNTHRITPWLILKYHRYKYIDRSN